jgi:Flp pilus assembly protein TadG
MNGDRPSRYGGEEGAAAVEAGVIMSVLLLLIVGSIELGRAFWTYNTMLLAVEEAGRYAMTSNHRAMLTCRPQSQALYCPTLSNTPLADCAATRAQQILSSYQAPNIGVSVGEDTSSFPTTITVCASYSMGFIAPQILPYGPLRLRSQVTVPLI